jgi:DNA-binding transcriptional LysR family regulator
MILIAPQLSVRDEKHPDSPREMMESRMILREEGSGTRYRWEEYKTIKGLKLPAPVLEVGSLSAIKSLVESGFGLSVMSSRAVEKEISLGTLRSRPFSTGPLVREMCFVYKYGSADSFRKDFISFIHGAL